MVMAPPSTGSDSSSRKAVISIDQTNSGILSNVMPGARMLKMVVMKLTAPRIEDAPARCIGKITMSTDMPPWPSALESGGYIVQNPDARRVGQEGVGKSQERGCTE